MLFIDMESWTKPYERGYVDLAIGGIMSTLRTSLFRSPSEKSSEQPG